MKKDQKRREMGELSRLKIEKEIKHLRTKEIEAAVVSKSDIRLIEPCKHYHQPLQQAGDTFGLM